MRRRRRRHAALRHCILTSLSRRFACGTIKVKQESRCSFLAPPLNQILELSQILVGTANRSTRSSARSFDGKGRIFSTQPVLRSARSGPRHERAYRGGTGERTNERCRICRLVLAAVGVARGRQGERGNFPRRGRGRGGEGRCFAIQI